MTLPNDFSSMKEDIKTQKKIVKEINSIFKDMKNLKDKAEKTMALSQVEELKKSLRLVNQKFPVHLNNINFVQPLKLSKVDLGISSKIGGDFSEFDEAQFNKIKDLNNITPVKLEEEKQKVTLKSHQNKLSRGDLKKLHEGITDLEKASLKNLLNKKKDVVIRKEKIPSKYVNFANSLFVKRARIMEKNDFFKTLKLDLIRANLEFLPMSYISVMLLTTMIAFFVGIFLFVFFLFFNLGPELPIITLMNGSILDRFIKTFWIIFAAPIGAFLLMYVYPSLEKSSIETGINRELPFATIHMSAIAGSMVDPSKIFQIMLTTKNYPFLEKEFTKIINEVNVYGHDLVSALRNAAYHSPSAKLSELFNGLATTITSGGDLTIFFEKRSQTLLFDYRLDREKQTKSAETFMDIYISVVIAAPMILMLLLMMMKISGLGVSLSTSMITLIMVLGVSVVNVGFLTFLHLKQSNE